MPSCPTKSCQKNKDLACNIITPQVATGRWGWRFGIWNSVSPVPYHQCQSIFCPKNKELICNIMAQTWIEISCQPKIRNEHWWICRQLRICWAITYL